MKKKKAGSMTPQKTSNNIIEDLAGSEGVESPIAGLRGMMIRMFNELKEDIKEKLNEYQGDTDKKLRKHRNK
jgi:hypothetical protein